METNQDRWEIRQAKIYQRMAEHGLYTNFPIGHMLGYGIADLMIMGIDTTDLSDS
jgi:hypothetical protein